MQCWGYNLRGQLGDGTTTNRLTPVLVSGLDIVPVEVSLGGSHTCVRSAAGAVRCWGQNTYGELGIGTTQNQPLPVAPTISAVTKIEAGYNFTCAITSGDLFCWGDRNYGKLGSGSATVNITSPQKVSGTAKYKSVALGNYHACGVTTSNTVSCWGYNKYGQVGDGTITDVFTPKAVAGLSNVEVVDVGAYFSCAKIVGSTTIYCWGANEQGQQGSPIATTVLSPRKVQHSLSSLDELVLGSKVSCVRQETDVSCWGSNNVGQLGYPSPATNPTPVSLQSIYN